MDTKNVANLSAKKQWQLIAMTEALGDLCLTIEDSLTVRRNDKDKQNDKKDSEKLLVLGSKQISREHAKFYVVNGQLYLKDLDSSNGTYVNEVALTPNKSTHIKPDDIIAFASFQFQVKYIPVETAVADLDSKTKLETNHENNHETQPLTNTAELSATASKEDNEQTQDNVLSSVATNADSPVSVTTETANISDSSETTNITDDSFETISDTEITNDTDNTNTIVTPTDTTDTPTPVTPINPIVDDDEIIKETTVSDASSVSTESPVTDTDSSSITDSALNTEIKATTDTQIDTVKAKEDVAENAQPNVIEPVETVTSSTAPATSTKVETPVNPLDTSLENHFEKHDDKPVIIAEKDNQTEDTDTIDKANNAKKDISAVTDGEDKTTQTSLQQEADPDILRAKQVATSQFATPENNDIGTNHNKAIDQAATNPATHPEQQEAKKASGGWFIWVFLAIIIIAIGIWMLGGR